MKNNKYMTFKEAKGTAKMVTVEARYFLPALPKLKKVREHITGWASVDITSN